MTGYHEINSNIYKNFEYHRKETASSAKIVKIAKIAKQMKSL
jgi:hypothetical protein